MWNSQVVHCLVPRWRFQATSMRRPVRPCAFQQETSEIGMGLSRKLFRSRSRPYAEIRVRD